MMSVKLYEEMFAKMYEAALVNAAIEEYESGVEGIPGKQFFEEMRTKYGK